VLVGQAQLLVMGQAGLIRLLPRLFLMAVGALAVTITTLVLLVVRVVERVLLTRVLVLERPIRASMVE